MKRILIIGGVAAGATAAARARRLDGRAHITILEAGPDVSFANCGLPYYIGGEVEHRSSLILAGPQTFHDQYRVEVHTDTEALRIDRADRTVYARDTRTGKETTYPYDTLILTQGGKPLVPALPGVEMNHVFQLWTLQDMDRIDRYIRDEKPRKAVVVGGGFIGLEMVEALAHRGLSVSVIEMAPHVMPNLEPEFAGFLTRELQEYGVDVYTGRSLARIMENRVELSDGSSIETDFILLPIGVRPTLSLARDAGLETGASGGLKVDSLLRTSDENIFAAGDMVEIEHTVLGRTVRIPLAGPANRQGRIAAENALGGNHHYRGAAGTSVVKLFGAVAGSTGLNLSVARNAGFDAHAVVVHKTSHTAYYPGADKVSLMVIFDKSDGRILGAQAAGRVGVDKRLDVMATAIAGGLTLGDLEDLDLAYAPPFNSPNGPVNMVAFTAGNHLTGFSPSVLAGDLESFVMDHEPIAIDVRDPISFNRAHLAGSSNLSQNMLRDTMDQIPRDQTVLLISEDGQKGHVALRMLVGAGLEKVFNLSGGYTSLERHARVLPFQHLRAGLLPIEQRSAVEVGNRSESDGDTGDISTGGGTGGNNTAALLVIDVRTPMEFSMGAYPGAVNISLDELPDRADELGHKNREIVLYCASGARSAYGQRLLEQMGFTNVRNGGSLHDVMAMAPG